MNALPDFTFSLAGEGVSIDPGTGLLKVSTEALFAGLGVVLTARDASGTPTSAFKITVTLGDDGTGGENEGEAGTDPEPVAAPAVTGALADQLYALGDGTRSVSTQAHFSGADLVYSLASAPPGVTIQPGSGLVTIPTGTALDGVVTARAENAGGVASLSFRVTVRALTTAFSEAAALSDLAFLATEAAPTMTFEPGGFARLVPAPLGRTHGIWSKAGGDGLYRVLARWSAANPASEGEPPFVFGARIARADGNFTGLYVAAQRGATAANRGLRICQYAGVGAAAAELAAVTAPWDWDTFYWLEVEIAGRAVRARFYPEAGAAPDWMIAAETSVPAGSGGFGPGAFPLAGVSPSVLVKRLEFSPIETATPAAAAAADWSLAQVTE